MEVRAVACEYVVREIARGIPPYRVNMVDVPLSVVILRKETWCLQPVVVRLTALDAAGPREVHGVELAARELLGFAVGEFFWDSADENVENCSE